MARKKTTPVKQAMTKTQVFADIAETTGLSRKQVASVFTELSSVVERHIKKGAVGQFTLPGLLKIKTVKRPARKAQKGVPNPFRPGELMDVAAKPATTRVKVLPLKKMKEMPL
jgi:nucleoid DNA-binding protein